MPPSIHVHQPAPATLAALRCPFCLAAPTGPLALCAACGALHHLGCYREFGRCAAGHCRSQVAQQAELTPGGALRGLGREVPPPLWIAPPLPPEQAQPPRGAGATFLRGLCRGAAWLSSAMLGAFAGMPPLAPSNEGRAVWLFSLLLGSALALVLWVHYMEDVEERARVNPACRRGILARACALSALCLLAGAGGFRYPQEVWSPQLPYLATALPLGTGLLALVGASSPWRKCRTRPDGARRR